MAKAIALLICDTPIPAVVAEHGDYHPIFATLLKSSLTLPSNNDFYYTLDPYYVTKQEYPDDDKPYDAFLITGSAASAYEDIEWINKLVAYVASLPSKRPNAKIFGICFGHQIVARAFGGECVPNGGKWEVGITPVDLTPVGKEIFGVDTLNIQQMHRDHVPYVPPGFELLGSTPVAHNQGMVRFSTTKDASTPAPITDVQMITLQGHPEFTKSIVSLVVQARAASGVISAELAEDVQRRADWRNDGVSIIGQALWKILGVEERKN
ncbi:hypothetical protein ONZ45_g8079 [Pleurotus djamor]|nr:hypothetical protein ONZ45_g8079 [Pleurotus djamor]